MSGTAPYRIVCERSGKWWAVSVPDLPGVYTQARRLDQVSAMAREALALFLNVDSSQIQVEIDDIVISQLDEAKTELATAQEEEADARAVHKRAQKRKQHAVEILLDEGLSQRDAGKVLGLSHQRISQMAHFQSRAHPRHV